MAKEAKALSPDFSHNEIKSRDSWLEAATNALRPLFATHGLTIPENIRFAIAFPSTGNRGKRVGETWHSEATTDHAYEIILRADLADPVEILGVLVRQLVHATLSATESKGKTYRAAAMKIGLEGKMLDAKPGPYLSERLHALAHDLPPLPHAALDIHWKAVDRKKKQKTRMLKAICLGKINPETNEHEDCGYTIRLSSIWAKKGALCPDHGPMMMELPEQDSEENETLLASTEDQPMHSAPHDQPDHRAVVESHQE